MSGYDSTKGDWNLDYRNLLKILEGIESFLSEMVFSETTGIAGLLILGCIPSPALCKYAGMVIGHLCSTVRMRDGMNSQQSVRHVLASKRTGS